MGQIHGLLLLCCHTGGWLGHRILSRGHVVSSALRSAHGRQHWLLGTADPPPWLWPVPALWVSGWVQLSVSFAGFILELPADLCFLLV